MLYARLHTVDGTLSERWARFKRDLNGDFVTLWVQLIKKRQAIGGELGDSQFLQRPGIGGDRLIILRIGESGEVKVCGIWEVVDESDDHVGRDTEKP